MTWVDTQSVFAYVGILQPKETGKFASNPGFQCMHEIIYDISNVAFMDCWQLEAQHCNLQHTDLDAFAKPDPTWKKLEEMSIRIAQTYIAGEKFPQECQKVMKERDQHFENMLPCNRTS